MPTITERLIIWRPETKEDGSTVVDCKVYSIENFDDSETISEVLTWDINETKKKFPYAMMDCNRLAKIVRSYGDKW